MGAADMGAGRAPGGELRVHAFPGAILDRAFLPDGCRVVSAGRDPDLVALAVGRRSPAAVQRQIVRARRRYGWGPLVIAHYGELAADPAANLADLDAVFSFTPGGAKNARHERYWRSAHLADHIAAREALAPDSLWARPKTRFCNFVYSNSSVGETAVRERFARLLMRRGRVDCPGRSLGNTFPLPRNEPDSDAGALAKLAYLAAYRFTIAFENVSADHYLTEKILHALLAGSIPIYWGCPQVARYYNPAAFVNSHEFASFEAVAQRVMAIEADTDRREAMRRAPMLHADSRIPALHADLEARWRALAERAVRRRALAPAPAQRHRRWAALLRRSLALELDPRWRFAFAARRARALGRHAAARLRGARRSIARGVRAGFAQARAEAAHVRGLRTTLRYLAWLGRRAKWALSGSRESAATAAAAECRPAPVAGPVLGATVCPPAFEARGHNARAVLSGCAPRLRVPALDPRVDNPVGWTANVEHRVLALGSAALLPPGALARRGVAVDRDAGALGHAHHVEDIGAFHLNTPARAVALARLAARGVPLHVLDDEPGLGDMLGGELYGLMRTGIPRGDVDRREAASIRLRRLALRDHAGVGAPPPTVSVLLATRRPERLAHALRAVAKQDWPRVELVLALHGDGFGDLCGVAGCGVSARVVRVGAERTLGEVLEAATATATGELLAKMDDDDRYDAHHLTDLVLAREYSGAALVGKGPEVVYLAGADVTLRCGRWRAERYCTDIAGGGLLIARADLARAGGWRPLPRGVDQALAADVAAMGGGVYRTHGSGFILVRHGHDHTWAAAERRFLAVADDVYRGWRPDLAAIGDEPCFAG